jgi:hypothetical protein
MIDEEEFQARIKSWAEANTIPLAQAAENIRRLNEALRSALSFAAVMESRSSPGTSST